MRNPVVLIVGLFVLAAFLGLIFLITQGHKQDDRLIAARQAIEVMEVNYTLVGKTSSNDTLTRIYDAQQNNDCYILGGFRAMSCVPRRDK